MLHGLVMVCESRYRRDGFYYVSAPFCREKKSAQGENSPWFRVNFVRYEQNFSSGRRKKFCFIVEVNRR